MSWELRDNALFHWAEEQCFPVVTEDFFFVYSFLAHIIQGYLKIRSIAAYITCAVKGHFVVYSRQTVDMFGRLVTLLNIVKQMVSVNLEPHGYSYTREDFGRMAITTWNSFA